MKKIAKGKKKMEKNAKTSQGLRNCPKGQGKVLLKKGFIKERHILELCVNYLYCTICLYIVQSMHCL